MKDWKRKKPEHHKKVVQDNHVLDALMLNLGVVMERPVPRIVVQSRLASHDAYMWPSQAESRIHRHGQDHTWDVTPIMPPVGWDELYETRMGQDIRRQQQDALNRMMRAYMASSIFFYDPMLNVPEPPKPPELLD